MRPQLPDRPARNRLRERLRARAGMQIPAGLVPGSLDLDGRRRTYSIAPAAERGAPLLIALHGGGGTGAGMAALSGFAERAPRAGFSVVFPDGFGGVWNDQRGAPRLARREGIDDVAFLDRLVQQLAHEHGTSPGPPFVTGISNGAFLAEHVARHALMPVAGLGLVAGTASEASRAAVPAPRHPTPVLMFAGTADPLVPYAGGPIGALGRIGARRGGARGQAGRGMAAPAETVAADWVATNGCSPTPAVDPVATRNRGLSVTRLTWTAPNRPSVTLFRIDGGGHTWPGGAPYLPPRIIGPVVTDLDASGILLDAFAATRRD